MKKLKNQLVRGVLFVACFLFFYSFTTTRVEPRLLDFAAAVKAGTILADIENNGGFSTESIILKVSNKSSNSIQIKIPAGTIFKPTDDGEQDLILPIDEIFVLNPKAQLNKTLDAYCMQASDLSPKEGGIARLAKNTDEKMEKLLAYFKTNKVNKADFQDAIWAVSDDRSICNIANESLESKNLRTFLAGLTGQENTWYSAPQRRTIQEDRTIQHETVTITGKISYNVPKGTVVYNEICREDGTSIHKTEGKAAPYGGKIEFTFTLRVQGWKKGNYSIKVRDDGKDIEVYPFSIV